MFRAEPRAADVRGIRSPGAELAARTERRDRTIVAAFLSVGAGLVAMWPYTSVIVAGGWSVLCAMMIVIVAATGMIVRLMRSGRLARGLWPAAAQVVVAAMALTLLIAPQGAFLGAFPTGSTLQTTGRLAAEAVEQVQFGTAPLADTPGLRAMLAIGFAVLTLLIDMLIAERLALLAIMLVATIGALPMIVTLGDANLPWFVLLALFALLLLRHSVRHDPRTPRRASAGVAMTVGAAAIASALVITPALPISTTWVGAGSSTQLDPSLRLGEDLRRPTPFTVMTLATDAPSAPYLRIASLSSFDGETWDPDDGDVQPVSEGFGEVDWTEDIEAVERRTSIRVTGISGSWLPVPFAATGITGISSGWQTMPSNRTVTSESRDAANEDYTVTAQVVQPTREQIQASSATTEAPDVDIPAFIAETAREVTADAATDYDRLVAMQSWFRSQFTYSLDAPVDGDFDGTGADAVEEFLRVRAGYCIHFAGAFALMTQSLDMQVRIVVGYLPGSLTDERRGDESIYTVDSDQLHAWPEVHFEGIGWVPFEPTASLGTPTDFLPETTGGGTSTDPDAPEPSAAPSAAPSTDPTRDEEQDPTTTTGTGPLQRLDPTPVMLVTAGILLVLLLPLLVRQLVRLRRMSMAKRGDAAAAWREVRARLVDLGLPVSDADSPRARGAALVDQGAAPADVALLVDAVERASYARHDDRQRDLAAALAHVGRDLRHGVDARDRITALLLPRSLIVGPPRDD